MEKHVLVIDDNADTVDLLKVTLERRGYRVATAGNAKEAEQQLALQPADLIVTDIFMDGGDGYDVIFKWRKQGMTSKLIVISGGGAAQGPNTFLETARLAGAHRTFLKPFNCYDLVRAVDELLEVPQLQLRRAVSSRRRPVPPKSNNSKPHGPT